MRADAARDGGCVRARHAARISRASGKRKVADADDARGGETEATVDVRAVRGGRDDRVRTIDARAGVHERTRDGKVHRRRVPGRNRVGKARSEK